VTGSFLSSYLSYKAFPKSLPAQGKLVVWFSEISELRSVSDRLIPDEAYCDSSVAELFVSGEDFYKYRGDKGIMISPHAINNGSNEKKSFKLKLWEEVKIIRSKSTFSGIHYPIRRKLHS